MLINEYDIDKNGGQSFEEFHIMALPSTDPKLRQKALIRKSDAKNVRDKCVPAEVEDHLANVIREELIYVRMVDNYKESLRKSADWSIDKGYKAIDTKVPKGAISRDEIQAFVDTHYRVISSRGMDAIIRRINTDGDDHISFQEFFEFFKGSVPRKTRHIKLVRVEHDPLLETYNYHAQPIPSRVRMAIAEQEMREQELEQLEAEQPQY